MMAIDYFSVCDCCSSSIGGYYPDVGLAIDARERPTSPCLATCMFRLCSRTRKIKWEKRRKILKDGLVHHIKQVL
jgi:hypothetical protein